MGMKTKSPKVGLLVGCFLILLLLVGGGVFFAMQIPPVNEQLPANAMPLLVTLSLPPNESDVSLDQFTTITAEAMSGKPIRALELWIDGALAQTKSAPAGSSLTRLSAFWTWTPASAGAHTLIVRARDADGRVGQSNTVRVIAAKTEPGSTQVGYTPKSGETLAGIAPQFKTTPQQILDLNPQLNPNNPLPPNQPINIPVPVPTSAPPDPGSTEAVPPPENPPAPPNDPPASPPGNAPNKWGLWIKILLDNILANKIPNAPTLWTKPENCSVRLTIQDNADNEDGFFIYRLAPATMAFERIATLDAHSSASPFQYIDSDVMIGEWYYYIAAFNAKGEAPSGIAHANLGQSNVLCAKLLEPTLVLSKGKLTFTQKIDKAYCYVAINSGKWTRIPSAPNAFIFPDKTGAFDVSPWLNQFPPGDVTLEIECWGWQGNVLVHLGKTKQAFKSNQKVDVLIAVDKLKFTGGVDPSNLPIFKPLDGSAQKIWLAPPTDLKVTGNGKVCTDHLPGPIAALGGAIICQEAIKDGYAILVWNWQPTFCPLGAGCILPGNPDGYRVYREGFPTEYVFKEIKGDKTTVAMFPMPPQPWALPPNAPIILKIKHELDTTLCYTVRAYKKIEQGIIESDDSNKLCLGKTQLSKTTQLKPTASLTRFRRTYEDCDLNYGTAPHYNSPPGPVVAGYQHSTANCDWWNVAHRGAVWFDVSNVPVPIAHARLKYKFVEGLDYLPANATGQTISCAAALMLGKEDWRGNPYGDKPITIPATDYLKLNPFDLVSPGHQFEIDVTTAVNEWLDHTRPNFGFVLRGPNEDTTGNHGNDDCASVYGDFELVIQHYGQ
ncbi:MAG: LysM peptidoglycan-binding domain-containing protein [Chloroflexi bacterium]|nr:LysM peptidoglycan-binding domain-containing protein [Chloroflexota bacterium]